MAETLVRCTEGTMNAIYDNLLLAAMLKGLGVDVAVLFFPEALLCLAERKFPLPPLLSTYSETAVDNMRKMGLTTSPMEALKMAKDAGVTVYACGTCADVFAVRDKLPAEMEILEMDDVVKLIAEAKKVIG